MIHFRVFITIAIVFLCSSIRSQTIHGIIYDSVSREAIPNAVITDNHHHTVTSNMSGHFVIETPYTMLSISCMGFDNKAFLVKNNNIRIPLQAATSVLKQVVVSANRNMGKRREAPVAIATISKQTIEDTKAQRLDNLVNKVSGVFMVNLGNEQHEMSIRQPMTTKSLFLYLEDGIPIRTTGVYNHNSLLEMNLPAAKSIEIIKGPASAIYGSEAIGGAVNLITQAPPAYTSGSISAQINNTGYKRADAQIGTTVGKWGIIASGYYANRTNGPIQHSNFHKGIGTVRADYNSGKKISWSNTFTLMDYYSDMTGALDSLKFLQKNYNTPYTFTYRSVYALRYKSTLNYEWNKNAVTNISLVYRNNSVKQNPSYSISSTSNPSVFKGQINDNLFKSYDIFLQHVQKINWLDSKIVAGASIDVSPQNYYANFISVHKDLTTGVFDSYTSPVPDSLLSKYKTDITNLATYLNYEMSPLKNVKLIAAIRYDAFRYNYVNTIPAGNKTPNAPSSINNYSKYTPKVGFTYNYHNIGFYGNYSQGFVPPQLTDLYSSVQVAPYLKPQTFYNYEIGGWFALAENKLYADWSLYLMNGTNEIISVRLPDNSYVNENSGKTRHKGVEYGITYKPFNDLSIRLSATNAKHTYINYVASGVDYSGKEMSGAPHFISNAEITYKPHAIRGLYVSAEWQHQGAYYMDDLNYHSYNGFNVLNLRTGYQLGKINVWVNALNVLNSYYAVIATKSSTSNGTAAYSYNLGDPREITFGMGYRFGK